MLRRGKECDTESLSPKRANAKGWLHTRRPRHGQLAEPGKNQALDRSQERERRGRGGEMARCPRQGWSEWWVATQELRAALGHLGHPLLPLSGNISRGERDASGKRLTVDFYQVREVGEEERQLFPG